VIALSHRDAQELSHLGAAVPEKISVLYPAVGAADRMGAPRGVRVERPVALYVGNFMAYQGLELLLDAAEIALAEHPTAEIRIAGGSVGHLGPRIARMPHFVSERIHFLGRIPLDEVGRLYEDADVLLLPRPDVPINRTTARKLGEYLAAGRTVVATDVGDHRRLLADGAGIVTAPTARSFAAGLTKAFAHPHADYATKSQRVAADWFALDRGLTQRLQIFDDVQRRSAAD
jgi:glycosyltransferase involved in cell wall biosynthesis